MRWSNKINVPLMRAIREMKIICHKSIPKASSAKQFQKRSLKGQHPTQNVMPKSNFRVISHLKSGMTRKLPPTPNIFLHSRLTTHEPHSNTTRPTSYHILNPLRLSTRIFSHAHSTKAIPQKSAIKSSFGPPTLPHQSESKLWTNLLGDLKHN
jgi:hypothetical protein